MNFKTKLFSLVVHSTRILVAVSGAVEAGQPQPIGEAGAHAAATVFVCDRHVTTKLCKSWAHLLARDGEIAREKALYGALVRFRLRHNLHICIEKISN